MTLAHRLFRGRGGEVRSRVRDTSAHPRGSLAATRLQVESLEDRRLLSASPHPENVPLARPLSELLDLVADPLTGPPSSAGYTPAQIRQYYGFDQIRFASGTIQGDGTGQTIAIVTAFDAPSIQADLNAFSDAFGLPDPPAFTKVNQNGDASPLPIVDSTGKWTVETALDVEWAHAIAPAASILLVEANSASLDDLIFAAVNTARKWTGVSVVSMSFGTSEFPGEDFYDSPFVTPANHGGVTFVAASGDGGNPGTYPAYSPNVLAVGGTILARDGSGNPVSETAWNLSGGGSSTQEPKPAYQNAIVPPTVTTGASPDVAFDASPTSGVWIYQSYNIGSGSPWRVVGGTSLGAPVWSALTAVANQGRILSGLPALDGLGGTLPKIYGMPASSFNDITSGSNGSNPPTTDAGPGYDQVTGRGTPRAQQVVTSLVGTGNVGGRVFSDTNSDGLLNGPDAGLANWQVYVDTNSNGAFDSPVTTTTSNTTVHVPDPGTTTASMTVGGLPPRIVDVDVTINNFSHLRDSDMVFTLISPSGTRVTLASGVGGQGDNFVNTTFDDAAATSINSGTAPFGNSFKPADLLSALNGEDPNGVWRLEMTDTLSFRAGTLTSWSLRVTASEPSTLSDAGGNYQFSLLPGNYRIGQVVQAGFVPTAPAGGLHNVTVTEGQTVSGKDFGDHNTAGPVPSVVARQLFYNNSAFDGATPGLAPQDDDAIATDKSPLTLGNPLATFDNVSSFRAGINGLMIDMVGVPGGIDASDFQFKVGNSNSPTAWAPAPPPAIVTVRANTPASGISRVEIIWPDRSITNTWLEVTVKATSHTGLTTPDVFYFGSRVGDSGSNIVGFVTNATDEINARNNIASSQPITNRYDYNRDRQVNATDQIIARNNLGSIIGLDLTQAAGPQATPALAANSGQPGDSVAATGGGHNASREPNGEVAFALSALGRRTDRPQDALVSGTWEVLRQIEAETNRPSRRELARWQLFERLAQSTARRHSPADRGLESDSPCGDTLVASILDELR